MSASTTVLVIVLVLVVAAAILAAPAVRSRTRGGRLRRTFGPEYDRVAARHGDNRAAERELSELEQTHRELRLQPLDEQSRDRYAAAWADAQAGFVDDPVAAERQVERIVGALLTAIGYPGQDVDRQLALAAVEYPASLAEYRRGYDMAHSDAAPPTGPTAGDSVAAQDDAKYAKYESQDDGADYRRDGSAAGTPSADADADVATNGARPASAQTGSPAAAAASSAADSNGGLSTSETETLRQAMLHYRVFFEDLLGRPQQIVAP
ncbi:MAG TPA: hypothetical protein VGM10_34615 [Actinocrinis sp.]